MNVFVLNAGRSGSQTFHKACTYITNYTSGHEILIGKAYTDRLSYPPNHIEIDNRLSWFLGRVDDKYGDQAFYVHLIRNRSDVAKSYLKRLNYGIIRAYSYGILMIDKAGYTPEQICLDYYDTVYANIRLFLKNKPHCSMHFRIENAEQDFKSFWSLIGAQGDIDKAINEFNNYRIQLMERREA